jgi:hypothetical protein
VLKELGPAPLWSKSRQGRTSNSVQTEALTGLPGKANTSFLQVSPSVVLSIVMNVVGFPGFMFILKSYSS